MGHLECIGFEERTKWNCIVKSFAAYDTYYLNEYVSAFRHTNDGEPLLLYYQGDDMRLCYVVQQSDIADTAEFDGHVQRGEYFDWSTPYGYGGPLTEGQDLREVADFFRQLIRYCREQRVVSQFIRFHPLLQNQSLFESYCDLRRLKHTVVIDTSDRQVIASNLDAKNRNMIRKAEKNGIQIKIDNSDAAKAVFVELYRGTMDRNRASDYYYFNAAFFADTFASLEGNCSLFSAWLGDEIASSAIIMHSADKMHYHLSASRREYMHLAPNNLLLYTAACWGADNGFQAFHLGGGVAAEDSLFAFKRSFNKQGLADFYIGRTIFCEDGYSKLLNIRAASDVHFNPANQHMIQYRA
ncbi:GNAT family N-acetyltransferase [Paenibacillus lycopersici]|uniref:GNAT family N-acetyltransferase n=1 Tax=Paenibacillus lycopersici TaxID=2704462 RepID=A0A6C0G7A3_9BACL|nr:GNAT family N-acetyltransferase [Paenibacillus lycopersici]QHT63435.1 GNAT family N-acetyltransferase [Paenibacillus lycopersici]